MVIPINQSKFFGSRPVLNFASAPSAVSGAGGGDPGGPGGGTPGGGAGGGTPAPSAPGGSGGGAPPAAIDWKTAPEQFRSGYEKIKSDYEKLQGEFKPWQDWAKESGVGVDQLGNVHGTYQEVYEVISTAAEQLGYAEDEIAEAVEKHGIVKVLNHLQGETARGQQTAGQGGEDDLETRIEQAVNQRFAPIQERENARLTDAANTRFEQIVHESIVGAYRAEGIDVANVPKEESFMLMNATSEILKYDEKALIALKQGKGQADVQKAFHQAKTFLDQYYLARSGRERVRIQGPPRVQQPGQPERRPTLDEMAEEPTLINPKYKVGA